MTQAELLVIGAGAMGAQIAALGARAGLETTLVDASPEALERARIALSGRWERMVERGRLSSEEAAGARGRLVFREDLVAGATGAGFVIEAVVEDLQVKQEVFESISPVVNPAAVITSNSSSFVPSQMASFAPFADRFCNMHFFNPALVMACVEIVRGPETSEETVAATVALALRMGKRPVVLDKEIPGFVANRIVNAVRDEAIALHEGGYASLAVIDEVCRSALGYPMGPFELMDLTGLDIGYATKSARHAVTGDPADAPARSLVERVRRGDLGRKTGRGWFSYGADGTRIEED